MLWFRTVIVSCPQLIAIDSDRHCVYQYPYRTDCNYCTFSMLGSCYRPQRSWAKVIFSQAYVKNSVHGGGRGCLPQCMLGYTPPPDQADNPLDQADTPPEQTPPDQADYPPPEQTPPPGKQTQANGLRAAGTHPTGMHSCLFYAYDKHIVRYLTILLSL